MLSILEFRLIHSFHCLEFPSSSSLSIPSNPSFSKTNVSSWKIKQRLILFSFNLNHYLLSCTWPHIWQDKQTLSEVLNFQVIAPTTWKDKFTNKYESYIKPLSSFWKLPDITYILFFTFYFFSYNAGTQSSTINALGKI